MKKNEGRGRQYKIIGQIGEYLVSAELGRRGYIATTFTGNVPEFDILVTDRKLKTLPIQVKTIRKGGAFQSTLTNWVELEFVKDKQIVRKKARLVNPNLIYVMVVLGEGYGDDEFYLLTERQLQALYFKIHREWLKEHGGRRPRKPHSLHCAVKPELMEKYRDNWKILVAKRISK